MAYHIKFLSLHKAELEYEVGIRGETPAGTVIEMRKQISKLSTLFPSEDILNSSFDTNTDLLGVNASLSKVATVLDGEALPDKNALLRTQNLLHHIYHRLKRIQPTDTQSKSMRDSAILKFKDYYRKYDAIKDSVVDPLDFQADEQEVTSPLNIKVTCERGISGEISKFKYDGKTCVRTFIQRISEFCDARKIDDSKLLSYCTEIFVGDALHWYRSVKANIKNWSELVDILIKDFGPSDYDYRLISEIRSRTQGETENITIYLSIMTGMFSRLSKTLSEEEKLEIVLHNIRPTYTSTLAAVSEIKDIDSLKTICRNYENFQSRLAHFHEPAKPSAEMLAPEFAYTGGMSHNKYFNRQNYNQKSNNTFYKNNNNYNNENTRYKHYNNKNCNNKNFNNKNTKYENLNAIDTNTTDNKKRFCPRCRVDTHNLRQCTANKDYVFCFVCGRKDVKTPQCPTCSENRHKASTSKN